MSELCAMETSLVVLAKLSRHINPQHWKSHQCSPPTSVVTRLIWGIPPLSLGMEDEGNNQSLSKRVSISQDVNKENTYPYKPRTSPKIRIRTMPTKTRDCSINALTPDSPTTPMQYPAAKPVIPTATPQPRCKNALQTTLADIEPKERRGHTQISYSSPQKGRSSLQQ